MGEPTPNPTNHSPLATILTTIAMSLDLDFENSTNLEVPNAESFQRWIDAALNHLEQDAGDDLELSLRIVDETEITGLNRQFRGKDKATNVLSFPADLPDEVGLNLLGDIAICAQVIEREAAEQDKTIEAHYAHMSIHGLLHLSGYDHVEDQEAEEMETLEAKILGHLGFGNPYEHSETNTDYSQQTVRKKNADHYTNRSQGDKLSV